MITSLDELTEDDLVRILVEPRNALVKQYRKLFAFEDCELVIEDDALKAIAHEASEHGTGARGLRSICERVLSNVMYDLPERSGKTKVVIKASDITGETSPDIDSGCRSIHKMNLAKKESSRCLIPIRTRVLFQLCRMGTPDL